MHSLLPRNHKPALLALLFVLSSLISSLQCAPALAEEDLTITRTPSIAFELTNEEKQKLGRAIARRELGAQGLIDWSGSEDFASLGVMHATWGSEKTIKHQNGFIKFLKYAVSRGATLPEFLKDNQENPWQSRGSFFYAKYSRDPRMVDLQQFLEMTKPLQIDFTIDRAAEACNKILADGNYDANDAAKLSELSKDVKGVFAIIDYVNFKGEGNIADPSNWGLANVLHEMDVAGGNEIDRFIAAAQKTLATHHPKYFMYKTGWIVRLNGYPRAIMAA